MSRYRYGLVPNTTLNWRARSYRVNPVIMGALLALSIALIIA